MKPIVPCVSVFAVAAAVACGSDPGAAPEPPPADAMPDDAGTGREVDRDGGDPKRDSGVDAGPDGQAAPPGDFCVEGGFCWQRPTPFGTTMTGVWGSAPSDVWAVGSRGTIAHYDGASWKLWPSVVTREHLSAVWGSGADDVWAVGSRGTILHFDGAAWTSQSSPTVANLNGISGSSKSQVDVVGDADTRLAWDGATWTLAPTLYPSAAKKPDLHGVATSPTGNAWCAADPYLLQVPRRSGGVWSLQDVNDTSISGSFRAVWGTSDSDVWLSAAPGGQGSLQHWNGVKWTNMYPPPASLMGLSPVAIAGTAADDVWFFGDSSGHWNGTAFDPQPTIAEEALLAGWVHPSGEGWAVGYGGRMGHKTAVGGPWSFTAGSPHASYDGLSDLAVISDDDVWAVGRLTLAHWDGTGWKDVPPATTAYRQEWNGVWASGTNDVWVTSWGSASPDNLQHWDGTKWSTTAHPGPDYLNAIWGSAADDIWVSFETSAPGGGGDGMHFDGQSWKVAAAGGPRGYAIHGSSASDVWSVGDAGKIRRFDGASWKDVASGTSSPLYAVRAFSPTDAWAGGEDGVLRRWNGTSWGPAASAPPLSTNATNAIVSIAGPSSSDLWIATRAGEVFHWDGAGWTRTAWLSVGLSTIARAPSGALFTCGANGAVLRRK